jgi:hypothetical protein
VDTNRTLLASTGAGTTGDAIVVGATDMVVQGCCFGEDGESGEKSEGGEELHDDVA